MGENLTKFNQSDREKKTESVLSLAFQLIKNYLLNPFNAGLALAKIVPFN